MESFFNDDFERQILEQALKSKEVLKALGPLNESWFEELTEQNEQFVKEMFNDSFAEESCGNFTDDDDHIQDLKLLKAVTDLENAESNSSNLLLKSQQPTEDISRASKVSNTCTRSTYCRSSTTSEQQWDKTFSAKEQLRSSINSRSHSSSSDTIIRQAIQQSRSNLTIEKNVSNGFSSPRHESNEQPSKKRKSEDLSEKLQLRCNFKQKNQSDSFNSVGFTTASNKPLKCSSESLKRARSLMEDIGAGRKDDASQDNETDRRSFAGFTTASNKPLSISSKALQKANSILSSIDENFDLSDATSFSKSDENSKTFQQQKENTGFIIRGNQSLPMSNSVFENPQNNAKSIEFSSPCNSVHKKNSDNNQTIAAQQNLSADQGKVDRRFSFGGVNSVNSPLFKPTKAKRRNSSYKPPRRTPLKDIPNNLQNSSSRETLSSPISKRQLGLKQDQENQIIVSDESLLKAMALFEQV